MRADFGNATSLDYEQAVGVFKRRQSVCYRKRRATRYEAL